MTHRQPQRLTRLAGFSLVLSMFLAACGGSSGGSADGGAVGGNPPSVQASMQDLGVQNLRLATPDGKVQVLEGSQASALVSFELDSGVDFSDLAWTTGDGSRGVDVQQANGRVVAVVNGGNLAAGVNETYALKVTNAKRGRYANFEFNAVVIAANTVAVGTVSSAGGTVGNGSTGINILPNGLKQAVGVKVIEGQLASGEKRIEVHFDGDVRGQGLVIKLPTLAQPGLDGGNFVSVQPRVVQSGGIRGRVQPLAVPGASCGVSTLNEHPYSSPSFTLFARELGFSSNGLGTQLWVGQDHFKNPLPGLINLFGWSDAALAFRVKNSTLSVNDQTALTTSFAGATLNPGTTTASSTTTTIATTVRHSFSLDTALMPSNPADCTAAGVIRGYPNWATSEPVLFVHGFYPFGLSGGKGTWGTFPDLVGKSFIPSTNKLVPFEFHWDTNADFKTVAGELAKSVRLISDASGKKVHIVGHSFGGVLSRVMLQGLATDIDEEGSRVSIDRVASLVTLGSPHSGVFKADSGVDLSTQSVPLPAGQDSGFFSACPQISCRQMGAEVESIGPWAAAIGYAPDDHRLGGIAGQLAASKDRLGLPPGQTTSSSDVLPVFVGLGMTATYGKFGAGDYLISFAGQRFVNHQTAAAAVDAQLLTNAMFGRAKVTEVILGYEGNPEVRPGQDAQRSAAFTGRDNGYVHASISSWSNLFTSDGNTAWLDKLVPGNYGLEAGPDAGCDQPITCFHSGYKLLIRAMGATQVEGLPIGSYGRELAVQDASLLAISARKIQALGLNSDQVAAIQGVLDEIRTNQWISGTNIRWDLVPAERLVHFNNVLGANLPVDTAAQLSVKKRLEDQAEAFNVFTGKLLADQNKLVTLDAATAFAFGQILLNGAQASYAAVQIAAPALTIAITKGERVLTRSVSPRTLKALSLIEKSMPWIDILKDCGISAAEHYAAINAQLALPPEQINAAQLVDALRSDVTCLAGLVSKLNEPAKAMQLTALASQVVVDIDGTSVGMVMAITDAVSGILDLFEPSIASERIAGLFSYVHEWFDTYAVAAKLQVHVGEDVVLHQSEVQFLVDHMRKALLNDYARQMVATRAQGLFVVTNPRIELATGAPINGVVLTAGETISLRVANAPEDTVTIEWSFNGVVSTALTAVADFFNYIVTMTADALTTIAARLMDVGGSVIVVANDILSTRCPSPLLPAAGHCVAASTAQVSAIRADDKGAIVDIPTGGTTSDTTPSLSGTVGAALTSGQKVNIYDGDKLFDAVAVVTGLNWTFTPASPLGSGIHAFTAEVASFDGTPGPRSVPYVISIDASAVTAVTPGEIVRTLTGTFDIAGRDLPTSGLSVTVPGDPRASCRSSNNMTAVGFGVACTFFKLGAQVLEVRTATMLIGTLQVTVKSNVSGVTWASSSTTDSGTVKFGETVTFKVAGVNLLADPVMGFAVELCGVSNAESGAGADTQRTFTCTFNNEAGAVAGQMPGVVKDAPGGQVLFDGWNVPVEVPAATGTIDLPSTSFVRGENVALSANGYGADTLMTAPPYVTAPNAAEWDFTAPRAGTYELFAEYAAAESRPVVISFNGTVQFNGALSAVTGGWFPANRRVISQGLVQLAAGTTTMRVIRGDAFPHVRRFSLQIKSTGGLASTLTDTGVTAGQCLRAGGGGLIECASFEAIALSDLQDGMVGRDAGGASNDNIDGKLGFSYAHTSGGCVTDNVTGLVWEVKAADGGLRDRAKTYSNFDDSSKLQYGSSAPTQAAIDAPTNSRGFVNAVNMQGLCGFNDWRLPTAAELQSLLDYGAVGSGASIDPVWFPNTASYPYWTSSGYAGGASGAWMVDFLSGHVVSGGGSTGYRASLLHVRLVRADPR